MCGGHAELECTTQKGGVLLFMSLFGQPRSSRALQKLPAQRAGPRHLLRRAPKGDTRMIPRWDKGGGMEVKGEAILSAIPVLGGRWVGRRGALDPAVRADPGATTYSAGVVLAAEHRPALFLGSRWAAGWGGRNGRGSPLGFTVFWNWDWPLRLPLIPFLSHRVDMGFLLLETHSSPPLSLILPRFLGPSRFEASCLRQTRPDENPVAGRIREEGSMKLRWFNF